MVPINLLARCLIYASALSPLLLLPTHLFVLYFVVTRNIYSLYSQHLALTLALHPFPLPNVRFIFNKNELPNITIYTILSHDNHFFFQPALPTLFSLVTNHGGGKGFGYLRLIAAVVLSCNPLNRRLLFYRGIFMIPGRYQYFYPT